MERLTPEHVDKSFNFITKINVLLRMCLARFAQLMVNRPTARTIRNTITHLETQHSLLDNIRPNRSRPDAVKKI